jgi:hypothetical protein
MNTGNEEMGCAGAEEAACSLQPKMAFMFLTRGDVLHPQIWQEFFADAGDELPIFCMQKNLRQWGIGYRVWPDECRRCRPHGGIFRWCALPWH